MHDIYKYYPEYISDLQEKAQNLKDNYKVFAPKTGDKDEDETYKYVFDRCYYYMYRALNDNQNNKTKSI